MSMLLQATEAVAETTEQTMGLGELFLAGGWLMWPLLLLGGVTIFIFCERFWAQTGFTHGCEFYEPHPRSDL